MKSINKKPRKPPVLKEETIVKREFIARALKNYGHHLLSREQKIFNQLFPIFPNLDFWRSLELPYQLNSLAFFKQDRGWELLIAEWKKFNFRPQERDKIKLSETNFFLEKKNNVDMEDKNPHTPASLKNILNLW